LDDAGAVSVLLREPGSKCIVVFETSYPRNALSQFGRGGARTSANFQKVLAQIRAAQNKRQELVARHPAPKRCRAKPIFKGVHWLFPPENKQKDTSRWYRFLASWGAAVLRPY
jgi:hypothetical protein